MAEAIDTSDASETLPYNESDKERVRKRLENDIEQLREDIKKKKLHLSEILANNPRAEEMRENFRKEPLLSTLLAKEKLLEVELEIAKLGKLNFMPNDPVLLAVALHDELQEADQQARDTVAFCTTQMNELRVKLDGVALKIEKDTEIVDNLQTKIDQKRAENRISVENANKEKCKQLNEKIRKLKVRAGRLSTAMRTFMEEHFSQPDEDERDRRHYSKMQQPSYDRGTMKTMQELLESLVNVYVQTPQSAYVDIDDTWWSPYIEFLLRHNIGVLHPENRRRMRLDYAD